MKYFAAGFAGMIAVAIVISGLLWLLVVYCPIPTHGPEKYLMMCGITAAGLIILLAMIIAAAIFG